MCIEGIDGIVKVGNKKVKYTVSKKSLSIGHALVVKYGKFPFRKEIIIFGAETPLKLDELMSEFCTKDSLKSLAEKFLKATMIIKK